MNRHLLAKIAYRLGLLSKKTGFTSFDYVESLRKYFPNSERIRIVDDIMLLLEKNLHRERDIIRTGKPRWRRKVAIYRLYRTYYLSPGEITQIVYDCDIYCKSYSKRRIRIQGTIGQVFKWLCSKEKCILQRFMN